MSIPAVDDATALAASAARHSGRLTPVGRDLLDAYRAYRVLDTQAEERYRAITQSHPDNVEAWFMLGEARFHFGPLSGRSPLAARGAFERALALDASHSHALLHLARIAAIEGSAAPLDSIARRYDSRLASGDAEASRTLEIRALQAWVHRDSATIATISREADEADDLLASSLAIGALYFVADLEAARALTTRLAQPGHSPFAMHPARVILADLDVLGGRLGGGGLAPLPDHANADWRLESEALVAAEPAFGLPSAHVASVRARIEARRPFRTFVLGWWDKPPGPDALMRAHLLTILSWRLGDEESARRYAAEVVAATSGPLRPLALALAQSERAYAARSAGVPAETAAELARFPFGVFADRPAHLGPGERFAYGEVMIALGRDEDALPFFESFVGYHDTPFLALALLRQGEIHDRAGRRLRAAECYRRALRLWRGADEVFDPLVNAARAGLARVTR